MRGFELDWYDFTQLLAATPGTREEIRDLFQQGYGLGTIPLSIALFEQVCVVAAAPGQFRPITGFTAEGQGVLEMGHGLVRIAHSL